MKVIVLGATGMVGQGVLIECLRDPEVTDVLAVGRTKTSIIDEKLTDLVHRDFTDFSAVQGQFAAYDACFFCLGVTSVGLDERSYRRITYDFTVAAASAMAAAHPGMTFAYVSGQGTDSTEKGRTMWARVKGATENAILALPLEGYMFRPGYIQPGPGVVSKTRWYRAMYAGMKPLYPVLRRVAPGFTCTTEQLGQAMITVARTGAPTRILGSREIVALAGAAGQR